jgi:hypothetical protein
MSYMLCYAVAWTATMWIMFMPPVNVWGLLR